jgi:hypothetical protein
MAIRGLSHNLSEIMICSSNYRNRFVLDVKSQSQTLYIVSLVHLRTFPWVTQTKRHENRQAQGDIRRIKEGVALSLAIIEQEQRQVSKSEGNESAVGIAGMRGNLLVSCSERTTNPNTMSLRPFFGACIDIQIDRKVGGEYGRGTHVVVGDRRREWCNRVRRHSLA